MTSTTKPSQHDLTLLKTDILGRVTTPKDQREALLELFEKSAMSGAAFSRKHGLRYQTFASWRQNRRRERIAQGKEHPPALPVPLKRSAIVFQEAGIEQHQHSSCDKLTVEVSSGVRIHLESSGQIPMAAELIQTLQETPSC